jgi:hypothetical protein
MTAVRPTDRELYVRGSATVLVRQHVAHLKRARGNVCGAGELALARVMDVRTTRPLSDLAVAAPVQITDLG